MTTYLKTSAIGIIVIGVFFFTKGHGNVRNFVDPSPGAFNLPLLGAFGVGLVASLWAYKGWEAATYNAGEVKNPRKNLPLGILIGTVAVIVLYVLANLAYLYILPVGKIASSEGRVALEVMQTIGGPFLASLITFLILFSILGAAKPEHADRAARLFRHGPRRHVLRRRSPSAIPSSSPRMSPLWPSPAGA